MKPALQERVTFNLERVTFNLERVTFNLERVTFNLERVTFNLERVTFNLEGVTFNLEKGVGSSCRRKARKILVAAVPVFSRERERITKDAAFGSPITGAV